MKRAGLIKVLGILTIIVFTVGACGPDGGKDDPDGGPDIDLVQSDSEIGEDLLLEDTGDTLPDVLPDDQAEPDLDDMEIDDLDVPKMEELDIEADLPQVNPCQFPCETAEDCAGVLETDECFEAVCDWSEECAQWNIEQGNPDAVANQCMLQKIGECCTDAECEDDNICTINDRCDDHVCKYDKPENPPQECCQNVVLLSLDFEDGVWPLDEGVLYVNDIKFPDDNVIVSPVDSDCCGSTALYFGDPVCRTYYTGSFADCTPVSEIDCTEATEDEDCPEPNPTCKNGKCVPDIAPEPVHLQVVAPELILPADSQVAVQFRICTDTEASPGPAPLYDGLKLQAEKTDGTKDTLYTTFELEGSTDGECILVAADLSQYAGQSINLIWDFHTVDNNLNTFEGIYLDDIEVATYCATCQKESDCDDADWCSEDTCLKFANGTFDSGFCIYEEALPYCTICENIADCVGFGPHPDDSECWPAICSQVPEITSEVSFCQWTPNPACCNPADLPPTLFADGFESGDADGWSADATAGNDVGWQFKDGAGSPGDDSFGWCYANPACDSYDCGIPLCEGELAGPSFDLEGVPDNAFVKLTFDLFMETEWDEVPDGAYVEGTGIDTLTVEAVLQDGTSKLVWTSDVIAGTTKGEYKPVWADLSEFKGQTISLKFKFTTGDVTPANNDYEGIKIDEVSVEAVCKQVCTKDSDCPAADCATPSCVDGKCETEAIPECCTQTVNAECDDGDDCTTDSCNFGTQTCSHQFSGDPQCCTPTPAVYSEAFGETALGDMGWFLPETGNNCGDSFCDENGGESCATCPSDCNTCPVTWQLAAKDCFTPPNCLYFGNSANWSYDNNDEKAYGRVFSPPVELPPYGIPVVSFHLKLDTEHSDVCQLFVKPNTLDRLLVYAQTAPSVDSEDWTPYKGGTPIWHSMDWAFKGSTATAQGVSCVVDWKTVEFGIEDGMLAGQAIRFVFEFDSDDAFLNDFEGAYIDDLKVRTICSQDYECFSGLECMEENEVQPDCTIESCQAAQPDQGGSCVTEPNAADETCCEQPIVNGAAYDFDAPCTMEGWTTSSNSLVSWQVDSAQNYTENGSCALYFGNPLTYNYDAGGSPAKGTVVSPEIDVTNLDEVEVSFWLWMDVCDPQYFLDNLSLYIDHTVLAGLPPFNDNITVWETPCHSTEDAQCGQDPVGTPCDERGCGVIPQQQWVYQKVLVDLTQVNWANTPHLALFKFEFDSGDPSGNDCTGVYIDDFQVKELCQ